MLAYGLLERQLLYDGRNKTHNTLCFLVDAGDVSLFTYLIQTLVLYIYEYRLIVLHFLLKDSSLSVLLVSILDYFRSRPCTIS